MIASHVTLPVLVNAANDIGVRLESSSMSPNRHRVKLYPDTPAELYRPACKRCRERQESREWDEGGFIHQCRCRRWPDARGDAKYQRSSVSSGNRVHAVCWHGFRDFFRAVYRVEPDARFATAMDTWKDAADFEARFRETGHRNAGSQMCPISAAEACRCPESGYVGHDTESIVNRAIDYAESLPEPVSLITDDMGADDILVRPDGVTVERWSTYNRKMNDLLMGRSA
jgi:hypothetical protein